RRVLLPDLAGADADRDVVVAVLDVEVPNAARAAVEALRQVEDRERLHGDRGDVVAAAGAGERLLPLDQAAENPRRRRIDGDGRQAALPLAGAEHVVP